MRQSDLGEWPLRALAHGLFLRRETRGPLLRAMWCFALFAALLLDLLLLFPFASSALAQDALGGTLSMDGFHSPFVKVAEEVTPAVVAIRTIHSAGEDSGLQEMFREFFPKERHFRHPDFDVPGAGSGFLVSPDGYIVTNNHVITDADEIRVKLAGEDDPYLAQIVGSDPATDLAVIKIEAPSPLSYLRFGDSDAIRVGDWAIAIGNPLGQLEGSLTVGVISAKGRTDLAIAGADLLRYQDFLQTDAAINPGNSGGPLVDIQGNVIGVNTAINRSGQGIGFAIPARLTHYIYQQIVEYGRVRRGYLGIQMSSLHDWKTRHPECKATSGVVVSEVLEGTPANKGGLRPGDVLVAFDGIAVGSIPELRFRVAESPVGSTVHLDVLREAKALSLEVVLDEYDEAAVAAMLSPKDLSRPGKDWLGLDVSALNSEDPRVEELKERFDLGGDDGVLVISVEKDSPADRARLRSGDIIVEIEGLAISDIEAYEKQSAALADATRPLSFLVRRGDMNSYMELVPERVVTPVPRQP